MKKKLAVLLAVITLIFGIVCWSGIGYYSSGSAVQDLTTELVILHGEPYTGREVENGMESMDFSIKSDTFFLTNYNLRRFWGWDYRYNCTVTITVSSDEGIASVQTIHYVGIDPMGADEDGVRAYIDASSAKKQSSLS